MKQSVRFRAPEEGDFVPLDVPGFEDFPTEFGVRYEPLKRLADSPEIPRIRTAEAKQEECRPIRFPSLGLTAKNIENDGEMSAYGTAEYRGAIVTEVERGSPAEKTGFLPGDVIVSWNGREIRSAADLGGCPLDPEAYHAIRVLRKQKDMTL